jgi:signal transduction histidine kinase/ActR/RegA family two-component response regulator
MGFAVKGLVARLVLLVSMALLPVLGYQIYAEQSARQVRQQLMEDEAMRLVRLVASEQQRIAEGAEQVLDTISSTPAVQDNRLPQCQRILANLLHRSPRYNDITVIGLDGHLLCSPRPIDPSINGSDRDYFQQALQTGGFVVGTYSIGRGSGQPTIHFAKPFTNGDGVVAGVIELGLNLDWLGQELGHLSLPAAAVSSIADRNGTILARVPPAPGYVGVPVIEATRFTLEGNQVAVAETTTRDGRPRMVAYSPPGAEPKGLSITVGLDQGVSFAAVTQANRMGLALMTASGLLALLITALAGARLIRRPVHRLLAVADRWRSGDLTARSGLPKDSSEFGRLGSAFDAMAAVLGEREAALHRLTENLEARVAAEVAARQAAQARAAQAERLQALGQLAGGIAHDFNNVLQVVEGAAALIERRPHDEAGVRRMARLTREAVGRGASITRRLLAFGRRADLHAEALDVAAMLTGMREIFAHTLGAAIEVEVRLADHLLPILADKRQLETVLVNLATNARDAMRGGGRLTLAAEPEIVPPDGPPHPLGLAPGHYVRLTIADTGKGMDAATLAHATEPFFTTKEAGAGTGLGLPMVRGFAEQSGGTLSIESSPGRGTTVTLCLPAADVRHPPGTAAAPAAEGAPADAASEATNITRLLLVDDEDLLREVLAEQLEDAGYSVLVAANGNEALALLATGEAVDVLITDLSMPGMDGLAVIRGAQERRPGLPAMLLTGYAGDGAAMAVGEAVSGSFSLLRKPIHLHDLIDHIKSQLAARANANRQVHT